MGALPVFGKATSPLTFLTHFPRKVSVCVPGNGFSEGNDPKMSLWSLGSLLNPGSAGGLKSAKSDLIQTMTLHKLDNLIRVTSSSDNRET